jgi:hypothetical protein
MRKALVILLGVCFLALFIGSVSAHGSKSVLEGIRESGPDLDKIAREIETGSYQRSAAVDTYTLVYYDFEEMNWQGWTSVDRWEQLGTFFHAEDFVGLGGGQYGHLVPLVDSISVWCGVEVDPADPYTCSFTSDGYGNVWDQRFTTSDFEFAGALKLSYHGYFDSEIAYDYNYVEYDTGDDVWEAIVVYDNPGGAGTGFEIIEEHTIPIAKAKTKLRFRFTSDGGWSDQDGDYTTDGACILDSITVACDTGVIDFEDFETWPVDYKGEEGVTFWFAEPAPAYGDYAGLMVNMEELDICDDNFTSQIVFFIGSGIPDYNYPDPAILKTPFCLGGGGLGAPCQTNEIWSPIIAIDSFTTNGDEVQDAAIPGADLPNLGGSYLEWDCYEDLPLTNMVFFRWWVREIIAGCPQIWQNDWTSWYNEAEMYYREHRELGEYGIGDNPIQIGIGTWDRCDIWFREPPDCSDHTPSPWVDNVEVTRYSQAGPQYKFDGWGRFTDNFPVDGDTANWVRADCSWGIDCYTLDGSPVVMGDSIYMHQCDSPIGGGIAVDVNGGLVYLHIKIHFEGNSSVNDKPEYISGASLQGTYGTYIGTSGNWTIIQADTCKYLDVVYEGRWCWDVNDSLLTWGYVSEYYFSAEDVAGSWNTLPTGGGGGTGAGLNLGYGPPADTYYEFTALPLFNSDILYVDAAATDYFPMLAFGEVLPADEQPDKFDVIWPGSNLNNRPGGLTTAALCRLVYQKFIWDLGNYSSGTLGDGISNEKAEDVQLITSFLTETTDHPVGVWIMGCNVGTELSTMSPAALNLLGPICGVEIDESSYYELTGGFAAGGVATPLVSCLSTGLDSVWGIYDTMTFWADGGCISINHFDVLDKTAGGEYCLQFPDYNGARYAGIYTSDSNAYDQPMKTLWTGFGFWYIRGDGYPPVPGDPDPIARNFLMASAIEFLGNDARDDITDVEVTPIATKLWQNYPNPFNPVTEIGYSVRDKGLVTIKIYNVAGKLVKTLLNEVKDAGSHKVKWYGKNNRGSNVASGVYFYKMETKGFTNTKKMVLLR